MKCSWSSINWSQLLNDIELCSGFVLDGGVLNNIGIVRGFFRGGGIRHKRLSYTYSRICILSQLGSNVSKPPEKSWMNDFIEVRFPGDFFLRIRQLNIMMGNMQKYPFIFRYCWWSQSYLFSLSLILLGAVSDKHVANLNF